MADLLPPGAPAGRRSGERSSRERLAHEATRIQSPSGPRFGGLRRGGAIVAAGIARRLDECVAREELLGSDDRDRRRRLTVGPARPGTLILADHGSKPVRISQPDRLRHVRAGRVSGRGRARVGWTDRVHGPRGDRPDRPDTGLDAREESTLSDEPVAPETSGVAVEVLATVDLTGEIEGLERRQLRMRMVTIEPGGVFGPIHDHVGRPGIVYVLQGTITDHRNGAVTDYGPGLGWPEDRTHDPLAREQGSDPGSGDLGRYRQARVNRGRTAEIQAECELSDVKFGALCWNQYTDWPSLLEAGHPGRSPRLRHALDLGPPVPDRRRLARARSTRAGSS